MGRDPGEILQLQGIVAKRKGSAYSAGRRPAWRKIKTEYAKEVERKRFDR